MAFRLIVSQILNTRCQVEPTPALNPDWLTQPRQLHAEIFRIFGQAVSIRHVDAGSCNGCELEIHALNGPCYNLEGLGVKFTASPRHADMLLVTGPVTWNLAEALRRTYAATPDPKWVVAVGDCGGGCGEIGALFGPNYATCGKVADVIPVDVTVPGCPPTPTALLQGILTAVSRPPHGG